MCKRLPLLAFILFANFALADVDALRSEANIAAANGEFNIAADKLRQLLLEAPDDGAAHYQLGSLMMDHSGNALDAIEHFERAGEENFQPLSVAYRLSRIYARIGRKPDALRQLKIMADGGFNQPNLLEQQPDYDSISENTLFLDALERIRAARFPCQADERHHAFDFWIGEWDVTQNGQAAGSNSIQPILGHCTIFEQWQSVSGSLGKSFNYYDPGENHWRQIWISDSGSFIEFTGEARDGGIFYTAETINPADGSVTHHKFEFTQIEGGRVRQFWQTSTDAQETWSTIWDGIYARQAE